MANNLITGICIFFIVIGYFTAVGIEDGVFETLKTIWLNQNVDKLSIFIFLLLFQLVFFIGYLTLSLLNRIIIYWKNSAVKAQNNYLNILKEVVINLPEISNEKMTQIGNDLSKKLFFNCRAETVVDENALVNYRFPQIWNELRTVEKERKKIYLPQSIKISEGQPNHEPGEFKGRKSSVKIVVSIAAAILLVIVLNNWKVYVPFLRSKMSVPPASGELTVYMEHKPAQWIDKECYKNYKYLTFYNASSENPLILPDSMPDLVNLSIYNASSAIIFPHSIPNIETITINNCELTEFPEFIQKSPNLHRIDFNRNKLSEIPDFLKKLELLWELRLNNNLIKEIPASVTNMRKITNFEIKNNQIDRLTDSLWKSESYEVFLDSNRLTTLPAYFDSVRIFRLSLSGNPLKTIPLSLSTNEYIRYLDLQDIGMSEIPVEIHTIKKLMSLNISSNPFSVVPPEISQLTDLEILNLDNTLIKTLPLELTDCKRIKEISLVNCPLESLPEGFKKIMLERYGSIRVQIDDRIPESLKTEFIRIFFQENVKIVKAK
jgi:Leucine-rich repeat (LRR) protein